MKNKGEILKCQEPYTYDDWGANKIPLLNEGL